MNKSLGGTAFFDYFDAKYLIHLPERKDRLELVRKQFAKHSFPFDGVTLSEGVKCLDKGGFRSPGVRGCFLAHLGVFKDALSRKAERVLIMEDDIGFCRDLLAYQERVVQELKTKPWDFAYFGNKISKEHRVSQPHEIMWTLPVQARLLGCHFYAVHGRILSRLIASLEAMLSRPDGSPEGGPMHIDGALGWFRRHNEGITALASRSILGIQTSSKSDIHKKERGALSGLSYFLRPIKRLMHIIKYGC